MAESSLSIAWQEHQARVASFLGFGRGAYYGDPAWTSTQQFEIDGIVASGLRSFYFPTIPGWTDWSFLKPTANLDLPSGASSIPLPDDWNGAVGPVTVLTTISTSQPWRIKWTNSGMIRQKYSITPAMIGPPMYVAETPLKGTAAQSGQRFQLDVFPLADQDYTLQVCYSIRPDYLSTPFPYAYGGAEHAETLLESCLAVAELRLDDMPGPHNARFKELLAASVAQDARRKPEKIGVNMDRSDFTQEEGREWNPHWWTGAATYNGSPFN